MYFYINLNVFCSLLGVWLLKEDAPQLDEDELRALVTPEAICQYESMMAEQQRLTDAEIILYDPFNTNSISDDSSAVIEDQEGNNENGGTVGRIGKVKSKQIEDLISAAPWNTTANFLGAVQGRCTLKLRGPGDPSGRGEAFSFVKAPGEKGTSSSVANSLGSEYRQDISRIWESHISNLSNNTHGNSYNVTPVNICTNSIPENSKLVISRRFGADQWINEEIIDPILIKAYLKIRQQQSSNTVDKSRRTFVAPDALPTLSASDAAPLSATNSSKKQKRPVKTSTAPTSISSTPSAVKTTQSGNEKSLLIKCGACGQIGHMRTNRVCPMFSDSSSPPISASGSTNSNPLVVPKLKLKISTVTSISHNSSVSSNESIFPSPVLLPVSHRPKGPPIEPITSTKKRPRKLTPKQIHAQFLSSQSVQVRSKLVALSTILISIVDSLILLPTTPAFHKPVSRKLYPLYYKLIKNPIDLNSIRCKAVALSYTCSAEFLNDFRLLLSNCEAFNGIETPISDVARDIFTRVETSINENEDIKEADSFLKVNIIVNHRDGAEAQDAEDHGADVSILTDGDETNVAEQDEEENVE